MGTSNHEGSEACFFIKKVDEYQAIIDLFGRAYLAEDNQALLVFIFFKDEFVNVKQLGSK